MSITDFFRNLFSKRLMTGCLGMVLVTVLLAGGALLFINVYTHHGEEINVPDICGVDQNVAIRKLEALGLKGEVVDTGYVYNAAPYSVLEQSVKAGEKVKPGRIIYLTINANGPRLIAIPDVADNCSRREAEDKLRILGFRLGPTEYVTGEPDWVVGVKVGGKNVPAGTKVSAGSLVTLVVGSGGVDEEYNGNDSLDYILNAPEEENDEIIESGGDAKSSSAGSGSATSSKEAE